MKTYKQSCKDLTQELIHVRKEFNQLLRRVSQIRDAQSIHRQSERQMQTDPYWIGMCNGIEFALSCVEDRKPDYSDLPPVRPANCMMIPPKPESIQSAESGGLT